MSQPPTNHVYPIEGDALSWDLVLADPPARTPYAERFTSIEILSDGTAFLETNDLSFLRRFIKDDPKDWVPVRIDGAKGRQTSWKFKGDESLIRVRPRRAKRPKSAENLAKKTEPQPPQQPALWDPRFDF